MSESILTSTKKVLGFDEDYEDFDIDITMHINSVFSTLNQLGVGPDIGFAITDKTALWSNFLIDSPKLNMVRSYMYMRVRLLFDPPGTSFAIEAIQKQILESEVRMQIAADPYPMIPGVLHG